MPDWKSSLGLPGGGSAPTGIGRMRATPGYDLLRGATPGFTPEQTGVPGRSTRSAPAPIPDTYGAIGKTSINFSDLGGSIDTSLDNQANEEGTLFGGMIGGLLTSIGVGGPALDVGRWFGDNILSAPTNAINAVMNLPAALPFGGSGFLDSMRMLAQAPDSSEKQAVMEAIKGDPLRAMEFTTQFAREVWQKDVESGKTPALLSDFGPAANLGDQVGKMIMSLGLPSRGVERTIAGATGRAEAVVARYDKGEDLGQHISPLVSQYKSGQITRDQLLDQLTLSGAGYSDDAMHNLLLSMVLDPLLVIGGAAGTGARMASTSGGKVAAKFGAALSEAAFDDLFRIGNASGLAKGRFLDPNRIVFEAAQKAGGYEAEIAAATKAADIGMATRGVVSLRKNPVLSPIFDVAQKINNPLEFFGRDDASRFANGYLSQQNTSGMVHAFGATNVENVLARVSDAGLDLTPLQYGAGVYAANMGRVWMARQVAKRVMSESRVLKLQPSVAIQAALKGMGSNIERHVEDFVDTVRPKYYSSGGPTGRAAVMATAREGTAQRLAHMYERPVDDFTDMVSDMSVEQMGFVDGAYFGFVIHQFQTAKDATLRLGKQTTVDLGRLTLIGPRNLTKSRAQQVLVAIETGDVNAVRAAVSQYEDLAYNFVEGELDDEALLKGVKAYIDGAMDDLSETLDVRGKDLVGLTSEEMADWADQFGGIGYQIGFAPEEGQLWRLIKNPATEEIVGVNPWIDWVDEASAGYRPDRLTRMREAMFRGIRGEKIQRQARDRFIRIATEWPEGAAVSVKDADAIFHAVMKAANAANIMPRGLSGDAMWEAARKVGLDPEIQSQIGPRQIAAAVTRAFEGNFATVGATQKASGILKTEASVFGNPIGQIAEHLYPMARFTMNPVFQAQEFVEPFILATMRGVKPGVRLSEYDRETIAIVNKLLKNGVHLKFDQAEYSDVMLWGASEARRTFGAGTRMARAMRAIVPDAVSRRVGFSVAEAKQVAYAGQIRKSLGDEMYLAFNQFEPGYWAELERHYGTVNRGEIAFRWLSEKVAAMSMDGNDAAIVARITKPNDLGKVAAVEIPYLRRLLGRETVDDLFNEARSGSLTRDEVQVALENIGASPEYIHRTWLTLTGVTPAEFESGLRTAFKLTPKAAKNLMVLVQAKADASGVDIREWIATHFEAAPLLVDSAGRIPRSAFFQSASELFGRKGVDLLPFDHPRVADTRARMDKYIPKGETVDFEKGGKGRGSKIAYDRVVAGGMDDLAPKATPTQILDKHGQVEVSVGKTPVRDWMKQLVTVLGKKGAGEAGRWYQEMATTFLALTDDMEEIHLRTILGSKYDEILSREQALLKGGTPESGGAMLPVGGEVKPVAFTADQAVKQEAAAKLLVSWGLSQLNTSPSAGWGNLLRLVDDIGWGRRPPVAQAWTHVDTVTGEALSKGKRLPSSVIAERQDRITKLMAEGDEAGLAKMVESGDAYYKGFGLNHDNLNRIMREGEAASQAKVGEKLFDFLDSIRLAGMRNYKSHLGDVRQPAAGDIWAARDVGFVDQTTLIRLASKMGVSVEDAAKKVGVLSRTDTRVMLPNAKGKPIFNQARYDALVKETGLQPVFVNVNDNMYEYIVQYYNDAAKYMNAEAFLDRTDWTAADAQAMGWVRAQKSFGIVSDDPSHIQALNSRQVAYEIKAGAGSRYADIFPQWDVLPEQAQREIMDDWNVYLIPKIEDLTGVRVTNSISSAGTWMEDSGASTFTKNATLELMGTDDQIQDAIEVIAYLSQQNAVYASRGLKGANTAIVSKGQRWAIDWVPDRVLTDDEMEELLHVATAKSADIASGAAIVTFDDGRKAIRTMYFGEGGSLKRKDFEAVWPEEKFDDFVDAALPKFGKVKAHRRVVSSLETEGNWLDEDNGSAILQSLRSRGRTPLADSLEREHGFDATANLDLIYERRAPGQYADHRAVLDAARAESGDTLYQFADTTVNESARFRAARDTYERLAREYADLEPGGRAAAGARPALRKALADMIRARVGGIDDVLYQMDSTFDEAFEAEIYTVDTYVHADEMMPFTTREQPSTRMIPKGREEGTALTRVRKGAYPELRYANAPVGVKPNTQIRSSAAITEAEEFAYKSYGRTKEPLCDSIGFSSYVGEFTGCQHLSGHAGDHIWHHSAGSSVKIERWTGSATYEQYVQFMSDQGINLQRGTGATPRTVRGAAAFAADGRATLYGTKNANRTTALHELAHVFERDLEPSMKAIVIAEMKKVAPAAGDTWSRETSEWFADGFNTYLATRKAPTPALATAFEFFAKWLKTILRVGKGVPKGVSDDMASLYDDLLKAPVEQAVPYDLEQETFLTAAVESLRRVEDEAYQTQYFKRSRSWTERSVNHPYLGYYPASYYWGKILPEMVRFLTMTPFGIKAPMAGWVAANKVWESVVTQKETDPEMRKFMSDNERAFRSWGMFIPATPWDISVNAAIPYRRLAQADMENKARVAAGKEPRDINTGKILKDTFSYAFGPAQSLQTFGQMAGWLEGGTESMLAGAEDQLNDVFSGGSGVLP